MKNFLLILACVHVSACVNACGANTDCTDDIKPGPVMVTIDCVDDARADAEELGNEPLMVEYQQNGESWKPCALYPGDDDHNHKPHSQLCDAEHPLSSRFECGDKPGTFYVRARQGNRSAGPIEVTGKLKKGDAGKCGNYTDKSLSYELSLDVEE